MANLNAIQFLFALDYFKFILIIVRKFAQSTRYNNQIKVTQLIQLTSFINKRQSHKAIY